MRRGRGIKRSENYLGKKLVTGDTPCHLILQATKICGQWSGNEASGWPCCVNKNHETISPACWWFAKIYAYENFPLYSMHTLYGWRVRVGRVCAHRMCMNEEQCGYKGEGVHSRVGQVWEMRSHTCVGEWGGRKVCTSVTQTVCVRVGGDIYIVCTWMKSVGIRGRVYMWDVSVQGTAVASFLVSFV